jgi:hypothetical protein
MFENRSKKQRTIIYAFIAFLTTLILALWHYYTGWPFIFIPVAAVIEYFCIFYILYLPLKLKGN